MSIGLIILIITGLLVIFGAGQRALDRLRLTDKQALLFIALIIAPGLCAGYTAGRERHRQPRRLRGAAHPLRLPVRARRHVEGARPRHRRLAGHGRGLLHHRPLHRR